MMWIRLVGSLKTQVSFAKEPYKRDYVLHKRPIFLRSVLIIANPIPYIANTIPWYNMWYSMKHTATHTATHTFQRTLQQTLQHTYNTLIQHVIFHETHCNTHCNTHISTHTATNTATHIQYLDTTCDIPWNAGVTGMTCLIPGHTQWVLSYVWVISYVLKCMRWLIRFMTHSCVCPNTIPWYNIWYCMKHTATHTATHTFQRALQQTLQHTYNTLIQHVISHETQVCHFVRPAVRICLDMTCLQTYMGWLRFVGSLKLQVFFAKETYKRDLYSAKRPIFLRSLLIVATP